MAVSRRPSLVLAGLLFVSLSLKAALGGLSLRTVETLVTSDDSTDAVELVALLQRHGFRADRDLADRSIPVVLAEAGECRLLVAIVAPHGWHRALVRQLAGPGNRTFFVVEGRIFADQPVWRTWSAHYWRVLNRYAGRVIPERPVLGITTSPACDLPDSLWRADARGEHGPANDQGAR